MDDNYERYRGRREDRDDDERSREGRRRYTYYYNQPENERFYEEREIGYGGQTARDYGGPSVRDYGREGDYSGEYSRTYGRNRDYGEKFRGRSERYRGRSGERSSEYGDREEDERWSAGRWRTPYERPYGESESRGRSRSTGYSPQYGYETDYGRRTGYSYTEGNTGDYGARDEWGGRNRLSSTSEAYGGGYDTEEYGRRRDYRDERRGPYSGRGPKGWQRSDERIREDVNETLARHSDIDPSEVEVKVNKGEVTLEGTVSDRWMKRHMEDVVFSVFGVQDVRNQVRVKRYSESSSSSTSKTNMSETNTNGNYETESQSKKRNNKMTGDNSSS